MEKGYKSVRHKSYGVSDLELRKKHQLSGDINNISDVEAVLFKAT